ncbi:ankyrin repeat domain-containing protein [Endozoicomonas sp. ISHI1]|uniref:ankyrin repeat domain-containing protein n=1 Tax=Endozoicomonas sp. ISHI1 TaxID=2825882 RepID=UPI0021493A39|nr:ankyrin repeat domain-containing protein [Endozoicomonas sp. ISHI1]
MDISKAGIQPFNYDGLTANEVTTKVTHDKDGKLSSINVFARLELPLRINLRKSDTQDSATPIVDRNIQAYSQASTSNEAAQSDSSDSFKTQKKPFTDDSEAESQQRNIMKREAMAISTGDANPERFAESLVKVITDPDSTDPDTSEAVRLIAEYGADELARLTIPFSFHMKTTRSFPAITLFALACRFGKLDLVKALYVNQEQLNQTFDMENGTNGNTAIMLAVIHGHANVVKYLLDLGADPLILNEDNRFAEHLNSAHNAGRPDSYIEIRELLADYRKERNLPPLEEPAMSGYYIEGTEKRVISVNIPEFFSEHPEFLEKFISDNPGFLSQLAGESPQFLSYLVIKYPELLERFFSEKPGFLSHIRRESPELMELLLSKNPDLLESLSKE